MAVSTNSWHSRSTQEVPDSVLTTLCTLPPLILTTVLRHRWDYYACSTDKEMEVSLRSWD